MLHIFEEDKRVDVEIEDLLTAIDGGYREDL